MGKHHPGAQPANETRAIAFFVTQDRDGCHLPVNNWTIHSELTRLSGGHAIAGTQRPHSSGWVTYELADRAACALKGDWL